MFEDVRVFVWSRYSVGPWFDCGQCVSIAHFAWTARYEQVDARKEVRNSALEVDPFIMRIKGRFAPSVLVRLRSSPLLSAPLLVFTFAV